MLADSKLQSRGLEFGVWGKQTPQARLLPLTAASSFLLLAFCVNFTPLRGGRQKLLGS